VTATAAPLSDDTGRRLEAPPWIGSAVGILGLVLLWQLLGSTLFSKSGSIPTPAEIVSAMRDDGFEFYWNNARATLSAAFKGWGYGNVIAIALALLVLITPVIERPLLQLGITSYCLPVVAIGPIFYIVFDSETQRVVLAGMSVFFTTLIGAILGLRSADMTSLDVIHAYGGGSVKKLTKVRLRASLPSLFAALRIASPAAILGASIGEYLGAERGLGVAMINSQQALNVPRTWALALVATAVAGGAYGLTALVGRVLTPWAPRNRR
jgi:ABC-type nitrate/sulfonate/bicarbonate transport system permease component